MFPSAVRPLFVWLMLTVLVRPAGAQTSETRGLRHALAGTPADSNQVLLLLKLAYSYRASQPDSTLLLTQQAWQLAQKVGFDKGRGRAQGLLGATLRERGELPKAYANQLIAHQISRQTHDLEGEAYSLTCFGNISTDLRQYRQAIGYYERSGRIYRRLNHPAWVAGTLTNMGNCYEKMNVLDSALRLQNQAAALIAQAPRSRLAVAALALRNMGTLQARLGQYPAALASYRQALHETAQTNDYRNRAMTQYCIALLYSKLQQPDSSLLYAQRAVRGAQAVSYRLTVMEAGRLLAALYQTRHRPDSALRYQGLSVLAHDSLFGPEKFRQLELLAFTEQQQQLRQREEHALQTARWQRLGLLAALGFILIIVLLLLRVNRQQRRANQVLNERNARIEAQRNGLDTALTELRNAQVQLVAAEKWAFVGELSAGIAHELQNPLNFMKNFAEVSVALLEQGRPGAAQPAGLEKKIMAGLKQNLLEISQHGQRASSIINDMLAHARTGTSAREPTDLNALVTEYLRLAEHGAPAPAAAVPAVLTTDLAPDLGLVAVVPHELGRALLNLFANALYAVRRRQQLGESGYQPRVTVSTRRVGGEVEIRVHDNGIGMSEAVAAQVFQPFFTTKPADEGTGLGLSLSHDIITQSHRGSLAVATREGEFTEFTVRMPG